MCEEACPTYAIQLTQDFELAEYERQNMVYEKQHLLIDGPGKHPDYNFYELSGKAVSGRAKGAGTHEAEPVNLKSLLP
jgi:NADH-quinone oxidoreductase subunit I